MPLLLPLQPTMRPCMQPTCLHVLAIALAINNAPRVVFPPCMQLFRHACSPLAPCSQGTPYSTGLPQYSPHLFRPDFLPGGGGSQKLWCCPIFLPCLRSWRAPGYGAQMQGNTCDCSTLANGESRSRCPGVGTHMVSRWQGAFLSPIGQGLVKGVSHHPPMSPNARNHKNTNTYTIMPRNGWSHCDILLGFPGVCLPRNAEVRPRSFMTWQSPISGRGFGGLHVFRAGVIPPDGFLTG